MFPRIFDCGESADDTLIICDFQILVERDVEVDLFDILVSLFSQQPHAQCSSIERIWDRSLTRMSTRLPLRSTSVIATLEDSDMLPVKSILGINKGQ